MSAYCITQTEAGNTKTVARILQHCDDSGPICICVIDSESQFGLFSDNKYLPTHQPPVFRMVHRPLSQFAPHIHYSAELYMSGQCLIQILAHHERCFLCISNIYDKIQQTCCKCVFLTSCYIPYFIFSSITNNISFLITAGGNEKPFTFSYKLRSE